MKNSAQWERLILKNKNEPQYKLQRCRVMGQWVILDQKTYTYIDFQFDGEGTKINMLEDLQIKVDNLNKQKQTK